MTIAPSDFHHHAHIGIGFVMSFFMLGVGMLGAFLLLFSTWIIGQRFGGKANEPVFVDVSNMVWDRMILNGCLVLLMMIENATLVWDNLTKCRHFPAEIRWPIDVLVVLGVVLSGCRLFRFYLQIAYERRTAAA